MTDMPPPPIHWYTKPNLDQQRTQNNQQSTSLRASHRSTDGLIPVYIHPDRLPDIEAALRLLGLPPLLNPRGDHTPATAASHEENINLTHPVPLQFQQRNDPQSVTGHDSNKDELDYSDFTRSFSQLSTSARHARQPAVQPDTSARHVPQPAVQPDMSPRKGLKKYYVVTVGKCTGVFWDEW